MRKLYVLGLFLMYTSFFVSSSLFSQDFLYKKDRSKVIRLMNVPKYRLNYDSLKARFISGDTNLSDFETITYMVQFSHLSHYDPELIQQEIISIYSLFVDSKFAEAKPLLDKVYAECPPCLQVNFLKSVYFSFINNEDSLSIYQKRVENIISSMYHCGDGLGHENGHFTLLEYDPVFIYSFEPFKLKKWGYSKSDDKELLLYYEILYPDIDGRIIDLKHYFHKGYPKKMQHNTKNLELIKAIEAKYNARNTARLKNLVLIFKRI